MSQIKVKNKILMPFENLKNGELFMFPELDGVWMKTCWVGDYYNCIQLENDDLYCGNGHEVHRVKEMIVTI